MNEDAPSAERFTGPRGPPELSVIARDGESPLIFLPPLVEFSGRQQSVCTVEMRLGVIGFEGQCSPVRGERLGVSSLALERDAEIAVRFDTVRLQCQRPFIM